MAIDWGLFQAPNIAGNALQGYRAARADGMDATEFQARQENREYERQQNALQTQRQIASEDRQTQDRHRAAAARLYTGLLGVPEAQRRERALAEVAGMGLSPEEQARVTAVINDPATTWDDASVRSQVMFLGGDVPEPRVINGRGGAYSLLDPFTNQRIGGYDPPMDPVERAYMEARTAATQAQVPLRQAQTERAQRPPAGRAGGGGRRGRSAAAGGIRSGGSGDTPAW